MTVDAIPQDTITAALARAVAEAPSRVFMDFLGDTYTFAEIDRLSTNLARGLLDLGAEPGRPIASLLDNNIDAVVAFLAIVKAGGVSAPVNTAFKGEFLRAQVADCNANIIIVESDYASRVVEVADGLPDLRHLVVRGASADISAKGLQVMALDDIRVADAPPIEDTAKPNTLAMLVYTSGTTGASKGCMVSHNQACFMGWNGIVRRGNRPDDILWTPLPLFHLNAIGNTVMAGIVGQSRAAVVPRFSVSQFWPEIERSGATIVMLLGSMASLIAEAPQSDAAKRCRGQIRQLRVSPFPPAVSDKWRDLFGLLKGGASSYGMTEASGISDRAEDAPEGPPNSSGQTKYDFEVQIVDEDDNALPDGTPGEIVCRPRRPNIMFQGYWNKPAETVKAWRNLWFHTGDLAKLDADGYLYFVDRKKDYIRRRGENISTHEMEAVFRQHPALVDVAVHAVRSPIGEDDVKVTAEVKPESGVTEEALCRWAIERVPYFAVPLYIEFRDSLPRGATGKVLKEQLRAEGRTARTWDREAAGLTFNRR